MIRQPSPRSPGLSPGVRWAALGGVVGPIGFIGAWSIGAALMGADYSSIEDAISRLAAVDAETRTLMTAGFVVFGIGLPVCAVALRRVVDGPAWIAAALTGLATLAVAATPLDRSAGVDRWHGVFAGIGYVTLAATPLLAYRSLRSRGHRALARAGLVAGGVSAAALLLTLTDLPTGLFQRLGLTATDLWIVASALAILTRRLGPSWSGPTGAPTADQSRGVVS